MLYFLSETERSGLYFEAMNRGIRSLLDGNQVEYREIPLDTVPDGDYGSLLSTLPKQHGDIWLLSDAASPAVLWLRDKPGRKAGHVHFPDTLPPSYASLLDILLVDSVWSRQMLPGTRAFHAPFPFEMPAAGYNQVGTRNNALVVFDQDFTADNLHIIEVFLCPKLKEMGLNPIHLTSAAAFALACRDRQTRALAGEGQKRGLRFTLYSSRTQYTSCLAGASLVISTALHGSPRLRSLSASAHGVPTLAPAWGPFPEFLPPEQLYPPFNLKELVRLAARLVLSGRPAPPALLPAEAEAYLSLLGVA